MRQHSAFFRALSSLVALAALCGSWVVGAPRTTSGQTPGQTLTGPFTYQNLTIYLIHGPDTLPGKTFLTLQEAFTQNKIVVYETGSVNQLEVENLSEQEDIYIQSGEIVKGGKQDRALAFDLIVPPKSGRMPITSFCVEHGRWTQRGSETVTRFSSSTEILSTKEQRLAAKQQNSQAEVWNQVSANQQQLSENVGQSVQSGSSPTSLQLTLESPEVKAAIEGYISTLQGIATNRTDTIGFAFAINGKMNSADVFASHDLFVKLWPKLLKGAAVEAYSNYQKGAKFAVLPREAIQKSLTEAEQGQSSEKTITSRVTMITRETEKNVCFETVDGKTKRPVHRNYVVK
ncbi:MAG: hypothetical protein K1Y36_18750 [Blastocatellia bacterium]|nr:hypothetical protein [Blastocatellia bacterium]